MNNIVLPYLFEPRDYQMPIFKAMDQGIRRFLLVMHRRGGKDKTCLNLMAREIFKRVGSYYYYFPTGALGKQILWDGFDDGGFKFLDHFPKDLILKKNENELKITFTNGSIFQIKGTDDLNVVGVNPVGCVFSEYAQQDPRVWPLIMPILLNNKGWAAFNGTPRGKNHLFKMKVMAQDDPDWYSDVLTVDDTGAVPMEDIEKARREGMSEEWIQQEYWCSFDFGVEGSYYAKIMDRASKEGRICDVPHDSLYGVFTCWDLGVDDYNAIWYLQQKQNWIHAIDYFEDNNEGMPYYINICKQKQSELGYNYIAHYGPHDIKVREYGAGAISRKATAKRLGFNFTAIDKIQVKQDGIDCVRGLLPLMRFDRIRCKRGIDALQNFQKKKNEALETYSEEPLRNWAKHGADALETGAVALKKYGDIADIGCVSQDDVIAFEEKHYTNVVV